MSVLASQISAQMLRGLLAPVRLLASFNAPLPERLLIAPQDIRTADPTIASDIYSGYFAFEGKIAQTHGNSPFELEAPSPAWAKALAEFGWLRHLRAADTALARANARALVDDWISLRGNPSRCIDWEPQVAARRLLAWLSQSPIILHGADRSFYRRVMKALGRTQGYLASALAGGLTGEPRLVVAIALAEYGICAEGSGKAQIRSAKILGDELNRQILADGCHMSRNPRVIVDLLLDLLPLTQAFSARGLQPPDQLLNSIDRMLPMVRMFRHADGSLAHFNGMGLTQPESLAVVLAYDDARAKALINAPHGGYQRLEGGSSIVLADCGAPPPPAFSKEAHAGCLSFEFSSQGERIIVNCGTSHQLRTGSQEAARVTAAHSTLILADTSSCRFAEGGFGQLVAGQIIAGLQHVEAKRIDRVDGCAFEASHDGYERKFGLIHKRRISLSADGHRLGGEDMLDEVPQRAKDTPMLETLPVAIRFHLLPFVEAEHVDDEAHVLISTPGGQAWLFEAHGLPLSLEASIYFPPLEGPRSCQQIVIHQPASRDLKVRWSMIRVERSEPESPNVDRDNWDETGPLSA